jgi:succinoglycan biosynthesis protein ExoA
MNDTPRVSVTVVMAVRNEGGYIRQSLGAVLAQDYPQELVEVVVADGMSSDDTRATIQTYQATHPTLKLIDNPGLIVSTGLNAAIREAHGDVIVRVDGHTVIEPDYVRSCVDELLASGADNVGGRMTGIGHGSFAQAVTLATSCPLGVGGARFHYSDEREWVDTVYLGAWKRSLFDSMGLFDEELVRDQDDELNYRLLDLGGRVLLSPRIKSSYVVRSKPRRLFSQYFQYGFWKVRVMQKHPRQMRLRHFVPPVFVLALATLTGLSFGSRAARRGLALLLFSYLPVIAVVSRGISKDQDPKVARYVPAVFPLLHVGYGTGFLWGLVRFAGRWARTQDEFNMAPTVRGESL